MRVSLSSEGFALGVEFCALFRAAPSFVSLAGLRFLGCFPGFGLLTNLGLSTGGMDNMAGFDHFCGQGAPNERIPST